MGRKHKDVMYLDRRKRMWIYNGEDGSWHLERDPEVEVVKKDYWHICVGGVFDSSYEYGTCFAAMEHYDHQPEDERP